MSEGRGTGGNRAVSPFVLLGPRGDLSGARAGAILQEGGSWGKHGFPHGSELEASDAHRASARRFAARRTCDRISPLNGLTTHQ
jgi:hypothetical protein